MNIILFGFKGSGKTHFGKLLAQKLGRPFIDTDDLIEELYAQKANERLPPNAIYRKIGNADFRSLETQAISTLRELKNAIISLGGGAVLDPMNVELLLKIGQLVYLEASFGTIRNRIKEVPAFADCDSLEKLYRERKPTYESIPARRIDTDALDEAGVLAALLSFAFLED